MSREDIEKLLGGYATGTLTPEELEALFAAAIEDQELFDVLAREEPLRELLQDPIAKTRLRAALDGSVIPWHQRWIRPMLRPALVAAAVAGIAVIAVMERKATRRPETVTIAQVPRPVPPEPVASPLPQTLEKSLTPEKKESPARRQFSEAILKLPVAPPSGSAKLPPPPQVLVTTGATPQAPVSPPPATRVLESAGLSATESVTVVVTAPPAPPPPPVTQPSPPPPVQGALGQQSLAGLRFAPVAGLKPGVAGAAPIQDARALFYGTLFQSVSQNVLVRSEKENRPPVRSVTGALTDAVATAPVAHLGVRYTVMLRLATGTFVEASPGRELDATDEVAVRLEANDGGYLYVFERGSDGAWSLLASDRVERMASYTVPRTGAWRLDDSRAKELFVLFSRQPLNPEDRILASREDQRLGGSAPERATYVVSTNADLASQRIGFPITLRRK